LLSLTIERQAFLPGPLLQDAPQVSEQDHIALDRLALAQRAQDQTGVCQREALVGRAVGGAQDLLLHQTPLLDRDTVEKFPIGYRVDGQNAAEKFPIGY